MLCETPTSVANSRTLQWLKPEPGGRSVLATIWDRLRDVMTGGRSDRGFVFEHRKSLCGKASEEATNLDRGVPHHPGDLHSR